MFNCYVHGWTSYERPCVICWPLWSLTSTSISIDIPVDHKNHKIHKIHMDNAELEDADEPKSDLDDEYRLKKPKRKKRP